jgi:aryl-alcohol dehydrogenase-like predicted oxidoreductase
MDDLVRAGKVLYVGFSDTPAWVVSQAVAIAELRGWIRPVGVQAPYSLADRSVEREVLPMAHALGLTAIPWGMLEGGVLTGKYKARTDEARRYGDDPQGEREMELALELGAVADEIGRSPSQVAISWVRQQPRDLVPILGARTEVQMKDNLGCLDLQLTANQIDRLSAAGSIELGFPRSFLESESVRGLIFGETFDLIEKKR